MLLWLRTILTGEFLIEMQRLPVRIYDSLFNGNWMVGICRISQVKNHFWSTEFFLECSFTISILELYYFGDNIWKSPNAPQSIFLNACNQMSPCEIMSISCKIIFYYSDLLSCPSMVTNFYFVFCAVLS